MRYPTGVLSIALSAPQWFLGHDQLTTPEIYLNLSAAGLKAATIVWIANPFTEEHWAALDWLNPGC